jgi:hypothetical protein
MTQQKSSTQNVSSLEQAKKKRARQKIEANILKKAIEILPTDTGEYPISVVDSHQILEKAADLPPSHDNEIAELICERFSLHKSECVGFKRTIQQIREEEQPAPTRKSKRINWATRDDYYHLFRGQLGALKRDIFSEKLMYQNQDGIWCPAVNALKILESEVDSLESSEHDIRFKVSRLEAHLARYERELAPTIIPNIPQWDNVDRIKQVANCLEIDENHQPAFNSEVVEALLKSWMAGIFRRIKFPAYQQRALILIGSQGAGKDYLIETLTGGFGQWSRNFTVFSNERDTQAQLHKAAVLRISEFDRTARTEVALLKHLITADHTALREAYARDDQYRLCRCSFVSSCNITDIFRDHTGNRRLLPLVLKGIKWDYPSADSDKAQYLAQAKHLFSAAYSLPAQTERILTDYLKDQTPPDPDDECSDAWEIVATNWLENDATDFEASEVRGRGFIRNEEIERYGLFKRVGTQLGWKERRIRMVLKQKGYFRRTKRAKGYSHETIQELGEASPETNRDSVEIPF